MKNSPYTGGQTDFKSMLKTPEETLKQLKQKNEYYRIALSQIKISMWKYDIEEKRVTRIFSDQWPQNFGNIIENVPDSLIGSRQIHPDSLSDFCQMHEDLRAGKEYISYIVKVKSTNSGYWWEKITYTVAPDENGKKCAIGISQDVTAQSEEERRYFQEGQYREAITPNMIASYRINLSQNKIEKAMLRDNNPLKDEIDSSTYDEFLQKRAGSMVHQTERKKGIEKFSCEALCRAYRQGHSFVSMEYQWGDPTGKIVWVCTTVNLMIAPGNADLYGFMYTRDIDEKKKTELSLIDRAERDSMTGLYNKVTTEAMIDKVIVNHHRKNRCAMLMVDLDHFKSINDTFGHLYGDRVIMESAQILQTIFSNNGILGRIGGDEFIVFLENISSLEWVKSKAIELCQALDSVVAEGRDYRISGSVGIAFGENTDNGFQDLYKKADMALYDAKQQGRNRYAIFTTEIAKKGLAILENACIAKDFFHTQCMMDELEDLVFAIDFETYEVLYINRIGKNIFAVNQENYIGRKCYELIHGLGKPCSFCNRQNVNWDCFQTWENSNEKLKRQFLIRDKLMMWRDRKVRLELFTDISLSTDKKSFLHNRDRTENILLDCVTALLSTDNLDETITFLLKAIGHFYEASCCCIFDIDTKSRIGKKIYEWQNADVSPKADSERSMEIPAWWMESFYQNEPIAFNDVHEIKEKHPTEYAFFKANGVTSLYLVPFVAQGVPVGFMGIHNISENSRNISLLDSLSYFVMSEMGKRRMQKKQEFLSYHDAMTELLNRNSYLEYMAITNEDSISSMGVLVADINGLKELNTGFGNEYGDTVIRQTADILRQNFGTKGTYRFSGDEFVVLCQDITHEAFIQKIQNSKADIEKAKIPNGVCMGHTWANIDIRIAKMISHADELLMIAKQEYYVHSQEAKKHYQPVQLNILMKAFEDHCFQMYLQPKMNIKTGKVAGAEALARYIHPKHGVISPDKFIPILEKEKLIRHLDFFIFKATCQMLQDWQQRGIPLIPISLNFSRVTLLEPDLIEQMLLIHRQYPVPRQFIEIEITESIGEMEQETIAAIGSGILKQGFRIALDDFGSKYTSLSILSIMQFHVLKIDRSMVNHLESNGTSQAIIRRTLELCKDIGIESVAEGVETSEQMVILKELGCHYVQGYFFSKPIPLQKFEQKYFVEKHQTKTEEHPV